MLMIFEQSKTTNGLFENNCDRIEEFVINPHKQGSN